MNIWKKKWRYGSQMDYIVVKRSEMNTVIDSKVFPGEQTVYQH